MHLPELLDAVRALVDEELLPLEEPFLRRGFAAVLPDLLAVRRKVKERGLWAPPLPPE